MAHIVTLKHELEVTTKERDEARSQVWRLRCELIDLRESLTYIAGPEKTHDVQTPDR